MIALLLFFILICAFGALLGYKRGLVKSAVRTLSLVISALLTLLTVGVILKSALLSAGYDILSVLTADLSQPQEIFEIGSVAFYISAAFASVIAAVIYFPVYFIINKLMLIPYVFVAKFAENKKLFADKLSPSVSKWTGLLVGVLGALITYSLFTMAFCGITSDIRPIAELDIIPEETADEITLAVQSFITTETATEKLIYKPFVSGTFRAITSYDLVANEKTYHFDLGNEINAASSLGVELTEVTGNDFQGLDIESVRSLTNLADAFEACESSGSMLPSLFSDVLVSASAAFENGDEFLGYDIASLGESERQAVCSLLDILTDESLTLSARIRKMEGIAENLVLTLNAVNFITSDSFDVEDISSTKALLADMNVDEIDATVSLIEDIIVSNSDYNDNVKRSMVSAMKNLLTDISAKELTDSEYEKEAYALNNLLNCALNPETLADEESAKRVVDSLVNSSVICDSIVNAKIEPISISEQENEALKGVLDSFETDSEKEKQILDAIGNLFSTNDR